MTIKTKVGLERKLAPWWWLDRFLYNGENPKDYPEKWNPVVKLTTGRRIVTVQVHHEAPDVNFFTVSVTDLWGRTDDYYNRYDDYPTMDTALRALIDTVEYIDGGSKKDLKAELVA
jgi:hypothetical protein